MKYLILMVLTAAMLLVSCDNSTIKKGSDESMTDKDNQAVTDESGDTGKSDADSAKNDSAVTDTLTDASGDTDTGGSDGEVNDNIINDSDNALVDTDIAETDTDSGKADEVVKPDADVIYYSSLSYHKEKDSYPGGKNVLEAAAKINDQWSGALLGDFPIPDDFNVNNGLLTFTIHMGASTNNYVFVSMYTADIGKKFPIDIKLGTPEMSSTRSTAAWQYSESVTEGYLVGNITITAFNEGNMPGATVALILSGDKLIFQPTN